MLSSGAKLANLEAENQIVHEKHYSTFLVVDKTDGTKYIKKIYDSIIKEETDLVDYFNSDLNTEYTTVNGNIDNDDQNKLLLIRRYVEGKPLSGLITNESDFNSENPSVFSCKLKICYKLILCLLDLHKNGLVHGNINPNNIIIDENGHPHILDNVSKNYLKFCHSKDLMCSKKKEYYPPEYNYFRHFDDSSDIYSLGVLTFELFSNKSFTTYDKKMHLLGPSYSNFVSYFPSCTPKSLIKLIHSCINESNLARPNIEKVYNKFTSGKITSDEQPLEFSQYVVSIPPVSSLLKETDLESISKEHFNNRKYFPLYHLCRVLLDQNPRNDCAKTTLGLMYSVDCFVKKDFEKANEMFSDCAKRDYPRALNALGISYLRGEGVEEDDAKAFNYFCQAASYNCPYGLSTLAHCYECGIIVEKSLKKCMEYYEKAANLGNKAAQCSYAFILSKRIRINRDFEKPVKYYQMAVDQNDARAQCNLGLIYERGIGVEKDTDKAFELYKLSANQGYPKALENVALSYYVGDIVSKDMEKALKYARKAKKSGNTDSVNKIRSIQDSV